MFIIRQKQKFELMVTATVFLMAVLGVIFFSNQQSIEGLWSWAIASLAFFFIFPAMVIKGLLKEKQRNFNLQIKIGWRKSIMALLASLIFFVVFSIIVVKLGWIDELGINSWVIASWGTLIFIETVLILPVVFAQEYFFRGFLQTLLERNLGFVYALSFQVIAVFAFEYFFQEQMSLLTGASVVILALFLTGIVKHTRSVWITTLVHWLILVATDFLIKKQFLS